MDEAKFTPNRRYTRKEIFKILGGDLVSNFPVHEGRVVYCCLLKVAHPDAPQVVLIGRQGRTSEFAKQLAVQPEAIPLFLRQSDDSLHYQGMFVAERYSDDKAEYARFAKRAHRLDVIGVLFMKQVNENYK